MKCPYRIQIDVIDGSSREYFEECYGKECKKKKKSYHMSTGEPYEECKKVESEYFHATHLGGK